MTSKEFVLWLKGFTEGVHEFNITPKQWDILKDKLAEVKDESIGFPIGVPNFTPASVPLPHYPNPLDNPYRINYGSGSSGTIITTPGVSSITYATPPFTTTSTAYGYPSGSSVNYTSGGEDDITKYHNED